MLLTSAGALAAGSRAYKVGGGGVAVQGRWGRCASSVLSTLFLGPPPKLGRGQAAASRPDEENVAVHGGG
jgi:hypothetical protein